MTIESTTHAKAQIVTYQQNKQGKDCCGDSYLSIETDTHFICALADGLGSGRLAKRSANIAMELIRKFHHEEVSTLLKKINHALVKERGVVITILKIDFLTNTLTYGNVGNISTYLLTEQGEVNRLLPVLGYLSGRPYQENVLKLPFYSGSTFLLHSDGASFSWVDSHWLQQSLSLNEAMEKLVSKMKYKDDDATIIIGRMYDEPKK